MTLKFVVLSDLHLVPEGQHCNGLDTAERLALAVESIVQDYSDADFVAIAGDLADRGEEAAYRRLQTLLAPLPMPVLLTLGNHDDPEAFRRVYAEAGQGPAGTSSVHDVKHARILILDSHQPGTHGGALGPDRRAWLADRLAEARDRAAIVILHHHALPLALPVDDIALTDASEFLAVLKTHPDVRQVISGHVHVTATGLWQGLPFTTLAGSHYTVSAHLPGTPGAQQYLEGPAQYAVVLSNPEATVVHFRNYIDRHLVLSPALFD